MDPKLVLIVDDEFEIAQAYEAVLRSASSEEIREEAIKNGMIPIYMDSMEKAAKGITSIEEVLRSVRKS